MALTGRDITSVLVTSGRVCLLGFSMEVEVGLPPEPLGSACLHLVKFFLLEIVEEKHIGSPLSHLSTFASGSLL